MSALDKKMTRTLRRTACSATRTVLVAFTRNLTQINAILPGEQCIHILRIIALGRLFRGAHGQFSNSSLAEADPTRQGFGTKLLTRVFGSKRKLLDCGLQRSRSIIVTIPRVSTRNKRRRQLPARQFARHLAPPPCAGVKVKPCGCCATLTPLVAVA